jgi:hypothetical protein
MPALHSQCLHASLPFLKQLIYFDSSDAWGHCDNNAGIGHLFMDTNAGEEKRFWENAG